ncbi:MAG: outer membrane lipoprotein chaperone LolA [Buchnera aphidicola (Meitanaphis elongallis)]
MQVPCLLAKDIKFEDRIFNIHDFYSLFKQEVTNKSGTIIKSGIGEIRIKELGWFNWNLMYPNPIKIISNSKTMWFYDSLVNQVNIFFMKNVIKNTPFVFFTEKNNKFLKNYNIFKKQDCFTLFPKIDVSTIKYYTICINSNSVIKKIQFVEKNNFKNVIIFYKQKLQKFDKNQFVFTSIPGVTVDDQR